jgi:hypothetical protein
MRSNPIQYGGVPSLSSRQHVNERYTLITIYDKTQETYVTTIHVTNKMRVQAQVANKAILSVSFPSTSISVLCWALQLLLLPCHVGDSN